MKLCIYLGLESSRPETQLGRKACSFIPRLEHSSAEQPPATTGFAQAPPYNR